MADQLVSKMREALSLNPRELQKQLQLTCKVFFGGGGANSVGGPGLGACFPRKEKKSL